MTTERILIEVTERGATQTAQNIRSIGTASKSSYDFLGLLKRGLATLGAAAAARELLQAADTSASLDNRIRSVTRSLTEFNFIQKETFAISQRTRTGLEDNVQLYQRLRVATSELGISQREILDVQELIDKSLVVGGASAIEASNALRQLTQGLASGALRGDEFRSVSEQLPFLLPLISKELGVSTGELKKMAEQGKITTSVIIGAFRNAREEIEGKFAASIATPSQAIVVLKNSFIQTIGELNRGIGITQALAQGTILLANNLELLAKTLITAGSAYAAFRAAQFISNRQEAIEATTKAIRDQGVVVVANTEREAQKAVSAVASARADLAATDAAIARTAAESGLAAALTSRDAAEKFAAIPERAALAETEAAIARIEAERGVAVTITEVAVADKAATVAASQLALANTQAALSEERLAAAAAARLAATGRGTLNVGVGTGALAAAGTGRIATSESSARISTLMAEEARQAQALAAAQVALASTQEAVNTGNLAAIATERQLTALRAIRQEQTLALAGAEANLAIEEQALVGSGLAASETEIMALRTTRATQAQGVAAAEAELAIANKAVANANIGVAASEPILTRALTSIKNGFRSLWTTIAANPILFLITAVTAASVALLINRDNIKLNSESSATLGDVTDALARRIDRVNDAFLKWANEGLKKVGIELKSLVPDFEDLLHFAAITQDIGTGQLGIATALQFAKARAQGKDVGDALIEGIKNGVTSGQFNTFLNSLINEATTTAAERLRVLKFNSGADFRFVLPRKETASKDEIEKATKAYEQLASSIDPAFDATIKLRDAEVALDAAVSLGIINRERATQVLEEMNLSLGDVGTSYSKIISDYEREIALLGETERKRRIEAGVLEAVNQLMSDKKTVTADMIATIRLYETALDDAAEKEKNLSDLQQLRSAVDPREAARRDIADAQKTLAESMRLGNIGTIDAAITLARYREANTDALEPVAALNRAHEDRMRLLTLSAEAQAVESEALQRRDALIASGIPKREIDIELIRRQVATERDSENQAQALADVLNRYGDASEDAAHDVQLLQLAHELGLDAAIDYAAAIDKANLAALQADRSGTAGLKRGLIQLKDTFSDFGSQVENGLVNSFRAAEDALLTFFKTGKIEAKAFADVVISELLRIAVQQTIMKGIATLGLAVFGKGGTTTAKTFGNGGIVDKPELFSFGGGSKIGIRGEAGSEAIMPLRNAGSQPTVGARVGDSVIDAPVGRLPGGNLGIDLSRFFDAAALDSSTYRGRLNPDAFADGGVFSSGSQLPVPAASLHVPQMRSGGGAGQAPVIHLTNTNYITVEASGAQLSVEQQQQLGAQASEIVNRAMEASMLQFATNEMRDGGMFSNPGRKF